jgi:hypothetical protein
VTAAEALTDERARQLAHEILSRPEYARFRPFDSDAFQYLFDQLRALFTWLSTLYVESPALWYALFTSLLLVSLALLGHVVWSIRVALRAGPPAPARRPGERPPDFALEAERLAAGGHLLEAAHAMHLACIERLLRTRAFELRRHDPNRTLRRRVAAAALVPELKGDFTRLLDQLEARWFRDPAPQPRDRDLFEAWRSLHARLPAAA